ncbi:MAG: GvpL/GvpF family gas vesicle protein [Gemmatimonadota bacterium]|nr:MAG: GvpL/GvpF family gas vesicle protein [Gemmatimonadota bacterium]
MAELEQSVAASDPATVDAGLLLHGVVRARGHERTLAKLPGTELVEHQGLAALVQVVPYRLPPWERELIQDHSSIIERAMRRLTIVPAPYGIVFRGREQVTEFLDDQHVALDEALGFLDGAFEMRLHITSSGRRPDASEFEQADQAASFYTALRRRSRAAFTLPPTGRRVLSAAFLVNRADWVSFVEFADELDADHPEFRLDLTGPWPPYDFVRIAFLPRERSGE